MNDFIKAIKESRTDLTDFLIHFTRQDKGLSAFQVLKKIINDGYLQAGWSERGLGLKKKRTVFGDTPAVCFTETPLYGFVDYAKKRNAKGSVDSYGIAFLKKNMWGRGCRPVIYGTTPYRVEQKNADGSITIEGFAKEEQYRYILSAIDEKNDWTHEREWRWANPYGYSKIGGLPIWRTSERSDWRFGDFYFIQSPIIVIVRVKKEKDELLEIFKKFGDEIKEEIRLKGSDKAETTLILSNINNTHILALEDCDFVSYPTYKIEDALKDRKLYPISPPPI